jgi:small subunit ribosomal protein S1
MDKDGNITAKRGDRIEAYVVSVRGGEVVLTSKIGKGSASPQILETAYRNGIPVEGKVTGSVKGGFSVTVSDIKCFCPFSQMDIKGADNEEAYLNRNFLFKITQYSERGRNIILSRRALLEEEKKEKEGELKKSLSVGDTVTGTVTSVQKFGIFIDLGGVEALVPRSELSWGRNADPADYKRGDSVTARVMDMDWENNRLTMSVKQTQTEPWKMVDTLSEGSVVTGSVTNIIKAGAFVELKPGLEGFIHISRMSLTKRVTRPEDAVSVGDTVRVRILGINRAEQKISLELETGEANPWQESSGGLRDAIHTGIVESFRPNGAHIRLPNGMLGFAPKEKLVAKGVDFQKEFPIGSEVKVVIVELDADGRRVTFSARDAVKKQEQEEFNMFRDKHASAGGSTLGDMLKGKFEELQKKVEK